MTITPFLNPKNIKIELNKYFVIFEEKMIWVCLTKKKSKSSLVGYADANYLFDPHKA